LRGGSLEKEYKCTVGPGFEYMGGIKACVQKREGVEQEKWYNGQASLFESEIELDLMFPFPI
jgi:hypothetical protein